MRKAALIAAIVSAPLLFAVTPAGARQQQFRTADEAEAMLYKAVHALNKDEGAALKKIKKGEGGFKDRDLYVFCFDTVTGKFTAHPNDKLIGTDVRTLKLRSGEAIGEKIFKTVKEDTFETRSDKGSMSSTAVVDYMLPKPGGTEPAPRQIVVTTVKNQGCGVAYYK